MQDNQSLSRRNFLKGGTAVIAGAAALGLAGCASSQEGDATLAATDGRQWDKETDVVVVGFGIAGTTAACEASDAGAEVILLEKAPKEESGGSSRVNGGFMTINAGYEDPEMCYRYWRGIYDKDVIEARLAAWPLMEEWIDANPIEGLEEYDSGDDKPGTGSSNTTEVLTQYVHPSGGWQIYPSLEVAVESRPIEVMYSSPATELIRDEETGIVIGVVAEQDGQPVAIKARRGVILTTGSYTGNAEMVKQFNHAGIYIASYDSPYNTGDAIPMVTAIGGQVWGFANESVEYQDWAIKQASEELGLGIRYMRPSGEACGHLIVNKAGERFMDEYINTRHNHTQLRVFDWDEVVNEYPNSPFWMVFDDAVMASKIGAYGATEEVDPAYGTAMLMTWNGVFKTYGWSDDNSEELAKGWIVKGDTLDELATNMRAKNYFGDDVTVDAEGLKAGVAAYNEACAVGEDTAFGRSAETLKPLGSGPYYAVELCPAAMYANAGPRVNAQNQVIDGDGNPIPHLYAGGQGCITFYGKSGNANALTAGIECGRTAAAEASWEA